MTNKNFNNGEIFFDYSDNWFLEDPDTKNNPDCIATLSKNENNLINVVTFETEASLKEFKPLMEDMLKEDGALIISSNIIEINDKSAIKLHANMTLPEINFNIRTFVFIEDFQIYIFELRTADDSETAVEDINNIAESFKIL
ncbi:hypothetical protein LJB96_02090 [Methanobrevibacter sp. OttesenSCG-928-K11]|nr:hypothetical protein [Methanobrevibacter sp. OttesenSCG-928-K11]MDL2270842.1 hypothetical protein [Methanobrevibacter sp. OttesenSCG-928-I08]